MEVEAEAEAEAIAHSVMPRRRIESPSRSSRKSDDLTHVAARGSTSHHGTHRWNRAKLSRRVQPGGMRRAMRRILVTGALGQIGSELVPALRARYGSDSVVASDVRMPVSPGVRGAVRVRRLPAPAPDRVGDPPLRHRHDLPPRGRTVRGGETKPLGGVGRQHGRRPHGPRGGPPAPVCRVPSELDRGLRTRRRRATAPRRTRSSGPTTMYGVTKVAAELLCDYYALPLRGRHPGRCGCRGWCPMWRPPAAGLPTTPSTIFSQAIRYRHYTCYLRPDTMLDLMYMPDAIRAMIELMEADPARLSHRNAYNVTAMSATPTSLAGADPPPRSLTS